MLRLDAGSGCGVIFKLSTGVLYTNQAGGYACRQPVIEGAYIPLETDHPKSVENALMEYFTGPKWRGHCYDGIDEETAEFIDSKLAQANFFPGMKVDRRLLGDSYEAWIHLTLEFCPVDEKSWEEFKMSSVASNKGSTNPASTFLYFGLEKTGAVLTWANSD